MSRVLLLATEWSPSKGGVSAFNQELAAALVRVGHEVHCIVGRAERDEVSNASRVRVTLHGAENRGAHTLGEPFDIPAPDVIVGHDRWSGDEAARWRSRYPAARLVHFLHVHPSQIDGLKTDESSRKQDTRIEDTRRRAALADLVAAVGPLLSGWWTADLHGIAVQPFHPGLPRLLPDTASTRPTHPRVLLMGRAEDAYLKGIPVAAQAMEQAALTCNEVQLLVRGADATSHKELENEVRRFYPKPRRLDIRAYATSREDVAGDLRSAWVVLQPSLEEGFGLVTLEALAVGTLPLVTDHSGVARLLLQCTSEASEIVVDSNDSGALAAAILWALQQPGEATARARRIAAAVDAKFSWDAAARQLIETALNTAQRTHTSPIRSAKEQLEDASQSLRRRPRLIDGRWVERAEQARIDTWLHAKAEEHPVLLLVGAPGTGKTALMGWLLEQAQKRDQAVLGIKADFIPGDVRTADDLQRHLKLDAPILDVLRGAASSDAAVLLVIDQLDALCEVVDQHTTRLNVLLELIRAASAAPGVRVVATVRPFELRHEARMRHVSENAEVLKLPGLSSSDLAQLGLQPPGQLAAELLTPHAVDLLQKLHANEQTFRWPSSVGELRERFWRHCIGDDPTLERVAVEHAERLAGEGALWGPSALGDEAHITKLVDRGLLQREADLTGFRHQTLLDLARSRGFVAEGALVETIVRRQMELNTRTLARSALLHLRSRDTAACLRELSALWDHPELTLHLRILLVDTLTEVAAPSPTEVRLFKKMVANERTRRRALNALGARPGWANALSDCLEAWMSDHAADSTLLAGAWLDVAPNDALNAMMRLWIHDAAGAERCLIVLSRARRLGPEADPLLEKLLPSLVESSSLWLTPLCDAIRTDSPVRASELCLRCIETEVDLALLGKGASRELGAVDELKATPPADVTPRLERALLRLRAAPYDRHFSLRDDVDEALRGTLVEFLRIEANERPVALFHRAAELPPESPLEKEYLTAFTGLNGHIAQRVEWVTANSSRLTHEHESRELLAALIDIDAAQCRAIEAAIDRVTVYGAPQDLETVHGNRGYRLYLRDALPREVRDSSRLAFDDAEQLQIRAHRPSVSYPMTLVRSPMTRDQLLRASVDDTLRAIAKPRNLRFRPDPVGGGDQVLSELSQLAETSPQKTLSIASALITRGQVENARGLLSALAAHLPDPYTAESTILAAFAADGAPLEIDQECASALERIARRVGLSEVALQRVFARLESATAPQERMGPTAPTQANQPALIRYLGGYGVPRGAYPWISALRAHYVFKAADHDAWAKAIRAALRSDSSAGTWRVLLDYCDPWHAFAGPHATPLLQEIEHHVPDEEVLRALTRAYAGSSRFIASDVEAFANRLVRSGETVAAAQLATHLWIRSKSTWAGAFLDNALKNDPQHCSAGVMALAGELMGEPEHLEAATSVAGSWALVAGPTDLHWLFADTEAAWKPNRFTKALLKAISPRVRQMNPETLGSTVFVLERFLAIDPELVLDVTEVALARALEHQNQYMIVSQCLALTFSLRLAVEGQAERIHALFENALAADAPAAFEALDVLDGVVDHPLWNVRLRPSRPRRPRRR